MVRLCLMSARFFFFKQKTADEMRISDWSSDVCSSDLMARRAPEPPARIRFLSPFDPMIRERDRTQRFFGFDYRFEAFVPAAKRVWGYYVLPMLERDRLIGRIELKAHRDRGEIEVRGLWLERGVRPAKPRLARLDRKGTRLNSSN